MTRKELRAIAKRISHVFLERALCVLGKERTY